MLNVNGLPAIVRRNSAICFRSSRSLDVFLVKERWDEYLRAAESHQ